MRDCVTTRAHHGVGTTPRRPFALLALLLPLVLFAPPPAAAVVGPTGFSIDNPFPTATFSFPMQILFLPDGRKLVAEKDGKVRVVTTSGLKLSTSFIDLTARILSTGDRGLMSIALDPDFSTNRWVYFLYTVDPDSNGIDNEIGTWARVERYRMSAADSNVVDLSSRQILLGVDWPSGIPEPGSELTHVAGSIRFGRDKSLLVGNGDGAHYSTYDRGGLDPASFGTGKTDPAEDIGAFRAQSLNSMCGKILRLDKETGHGLPSNPFWDGNPTSDRSRIWLYGMRNPYRFIVQPGTGSTNPADGQPGTLFIADVGWNTWEEVDIASAGGTNFGWPCFEGPLAAPTYPTLPQPAGCGCTSYGSVDNPATPTLPQGYWHHTDPAVAYPPGSIARCIIAGAYYNGAGYPASYRGKLFVADFTTAWMKALTLGGLDHLGHEQFSAIENFINSGAGSPGDIEVEPATGDIWYLSTYAGLVRRIRYVTGNRDPLASATLTPLYGLAPLSVVGDASATMDADNDPLQYVWRFGDGDSATTRVAPHVYDEDGVYDVEMEVRDNHGGVDRAGFTVVVGQIPPPGRIVLPADSASFRVGDDVTLDAVLVDTLAGPASYRWDVDLEHTEPDGHAHYHLSQRVMFGPHAQYPFTISTNDAPYANRIRLAVTQGAITIQDTAYVFPWQNVRVSALTSAVPVPSADHTIQVSATLTAGQGIGIAEFKWTLYDGNTLLLQESHGPMSPGASESITRTVGPLAAGNHLLRFVADSEARRQEYDEGDNEVTLPLHVRSAGEPFAVWRADSANGSGPFTSPDDPGPWRDLVSGYDAALESFASQAGDWQGDGSSASPYRLRMDGTSTRVRLATDGAIRPLQYPFLDDASAEIWFQPGADVTRTQHLLEWLESRSVPYPGLSLGLSAGRLRVDLSPWQDCGPLVPHAWTQALVSQSRDSVRVFVNGRRVYSGNYANRGSQVTAALLGCSARTAPATLTDFFGGAVGLVRLFDHALDDAAARAWFLRDSARFNPPVPAPHRVLVLAADSAAASGPRPPNTADSPWRDVSGGAHDAALGGFATVSDSSGWRGDGTSASPRRLEFDGIDDRASVPAASIPELQSLGPVTVALWFCAGLDVQRSQTLLEWVDTFGGARPGCSIGISGGMLRVALDPTRNIAPVRSGRWTHVVVREADDDVVVFVDGVAAYTGYHTNAGRQLSALALGASLVGTSGPFTNSFRGAIARAEVWQGRLSDAAVAALYQSESAPYLHRFEAAPTGAAFLSSTVTCLDVPFRFRREETVPMRGFSATIKLGAGLTLCGPIRAGEALTGGPQSVLEVQDRGAGVYTVDGVVLGATCITPSGALFIAPVSATIAAGSPTVSVTDILVRDCVNHPLGADPGDPLVVRVDTAAPLAVSAVTAAPVTTEASSYGTRLVRVFFQAPADAESVRVIRAPFGHYPEYDDIAGGGGAIPNLPGTWPPAPPWSLTNVGASGHTDDPGPRDVWYYAAFAWDSCGNRSPVSVRGGGVPNYRLGDVHRPGQDYTGDGLVGDDDLALLAAHYGASLVPSSDARAALDIGPTLDRSGATRPTTDNKIEFEDLMIEALDQDVVAPADGLPVTPSTLSLGVPPLPTVGNTFDVVIGITAGGALHGLSIDIGYDSTRVTPLSLRSGPLLEAQVLPFVMLTPGRATVDIALLGKGPGMRGSGTLGWMTFRRTALGDPGLRVLTTGRARDQANQDVTVGGNSIVLDSETEPLPAALSFSRGFPDPFHEGVAFTLGLPREAPVKVTSYDVLGRRVRTIVAGNLGAGFHRLEWDGRDDHDAPVPPGVYLLKLSSAGETRVRRVVCVR